jgi:Cu/Ag efflux pump CusA
LITLPVALVGGLLAVLLTGASITLGSVAGFVAVLGLATRGLILQIGHYQELERNEGLRFGRSLVLRGTRERLAPILMTLAAIGLVMIPFALAGGGPGLEIVRPIAIVILGGSLTTALLNVLIVPAAYLRFGRVEQPDTSSEDLIITIPEIDTVRG